MSERTIIKVLWDFIETGPTEIQRRLVDELISIAMGLTSTPQTQRSAGAERQARYRERNALRNGDVTNVTVSPPKEKNQTPLSPETLRVSTPQAKRLPIDWTPSENLLSWAKAELGLAGETLRFETDAFRDHFLSVGGAKGRKIDWDRTWCNWMRSHKRHQKKSNVVDFVPSGPKRSWAEIRAERGIKLIPDEPQ